MELLNKTIVITGVSSGIGAEVAKIARFHGARIIGLDRNEPGLTVDGFIHIDMGNINSIDNAIQQLPEKVDVLCNVAGVPGTADVELVGRVNYLGLRHLTDQLVERMPAGSSIVNIASILGAEWQQRLDLHKDLASVSSFENGQAWLKAHPVPQQTCYQYFKEALIVWSYVQSQKWFLEKSIRMNCVAPGPVFTPILGDFIQMLGQERVQKDSARMKRPAYADEIASVVAFLCSDASRWVSGVNIPVDGGLASTFI